jgi:phosphoribosylanthranilate isomerase
MTWVKICGTTNLEDALLAVEAGADAVGFVFHEKSPRKVDVETVRAIVAEMPESVEKVGVFVEQNAEEIRAIAERTGLGAVQVYCGVQGVETRVAQLESLVLTRRIWALPWSDLGRGLVISGRPDRPGDALLVDSGNNTIPGGTGKTFDWQGSRSILKGINSVMKVVVAGGLNANNVSEAMRTLEPFGVDVVSGVEAKPGKKDPEKVRAFVRAVREADRKAS